MTFVQKSARDLKVGDRMGTSKVVRVEPTMAVCSPRRGATAEAAVRVTLAGGIPLTLANDVSCKVEVS